MTYAVWRRVAMTMGLLVVGVVAVSFASAGPTDEERLAGIAAGGAPDERAQAVVALARLGSEFYPAARDAVAEDPDPAQIVALLKGIRAAGDTSTTACVVVEQCLQSGAFAIAQEASYVAKKVVPVRMETLWSRDRLRPPWTWHDDLAQWLVKATGVAAVQPWDDPVWTRLSRGARVQLLSRAGSREAIELLRPLVDGLEPRAARRSLVTAERGDADCLRILLFDPDPGLAMWASHSLLVLGDSEHLQGWLSHPLDERRRHAAQLPSVMNASC